MSLLFGNLVRQQNKSSFLSYLVFKLVDTLHCTDSAPNAGMQWRVGGEGPLPVGEPFNPADLYEDVQEEEETVEEKPKETGRIRSLFPETWLWDIVSVGWVG